MKEEKAVAIMMANLKGSKNKPSNLLEFAEACRVLKQKWGSFSDLAKYFKTSQYMLRQIDKINELDNPQYQKLIKDGKIGIDASYQLWRIKEPKRTKVAKMIKDMTTEDIRTFVHVLLKNPNLSLEESKKLFYKNKDEKMHLLVLPLDDEIYDKLSISAKKSNLTIHNFALKILTKELS